MFYRTTKFARMTSIILFIKFHASSKASSDTTFYVSFESWNATKKQREEKQMNNFRSLRHEQSMVQNEQKIIFPSFYSPCFSIPARRGRHIKLLHFHWLTTQTLRWVIEFLRLSLWKRLVFILSNGGKK